METDIRFYAITSHGRSLLRATTLKEALCEVNDTYYLRISARRIVKETRETVWDASQSLGDPRQMELEGI